MFLLNHIPPEKAEGQIAETYDLFRSRGVPVPAPLQLMSASPALAVQRGGQLRYYIDHDRLDFGLQAMIRYAVAAGFGYRWCTEFNAYLLKRAAGMTDKELRLLREDPASLDEDEPRKALLLFVLKVVRAPESVAAEDVEALRTLGWSDSDIFDASSYGVNMIAHGTLFKALAGNMGFTG